MGLYSVSRFGREFNYSFIGGGLIALTGLGTINYSLGIAGIGATLDVANQAIFVYLSAFFLMMGIFAFMGGISAMLQKSWYFGIMGGIFGIFSPGIFCSIISIIGLIFVIISKKEFYRYLSIYKKYNK